MLDRRKFLVLTIATGVAACAPRPNILMPAGTRLIILRHADRTGSDLNSVGRARAQALVAALNGEEIDALYSPDLQRNLDTVQPLATARGLPIHTIEGENPTRQLMKEGQGKTILWVGNKGNLAAIWNMLGATDPAPLEYGDLFIVETKDGAFPQVERRHFGP